MGALIEIIISGVKKFGGEIVAGVLLAVAVWIFPSLGKIFRKKNDSSDEVKEELERLKDTLKEVLQRNDEALRQTESQTAEEAERRAEIQRQLEEQKRKVQAQISGESAEAKTLYARGKKYYEANDYEQAEPLIRKAAELGYAKAQNTLGSMYYKRQRSGAGLYGGREVVSQSRRTGSCWHTIHSGEHVLQQRGSEAGLRRGC